MSEHRDPPTRDKFRWQTIALSLILLPTIPLYVVVNAGHLWATSILMALIAGGMILGMWVS